MVDQHFSTTALISKCNGTAVRRGLLNEPFKDSLSPRDFVGVINRCEHEASLSSDTKLEKFQPKARGVGHIFLAKLRYIKMYALQNKDITSYGVCQKCRIKRARKQNNDMKNQYFGDINDYRKYGLLRSILRAGDFKLLTA